MKIAISAAGPSLDADAEPRFGRCPYFIVVDPETLEYEAVDNSATMAAGGAGISAAQAIAGKGVKAVLTGNCGPNAYQVLSAAGIQVITGISGKVKDAAESYRLGKFKASETANVPDHFGMGGGSGMVGGSGMGRGMGRGRGMGMGMGRGMGFGMPSPTGPSPQQQSPEEELQALKNQSQTIAQQLADIQRRIKELEKK
jgi:predicted Fe-Mo cluster-binding NifX family protein